MFGRRAAAACGIVALLFSGCGEDSAAPTVPTPAPPTPDPEPPPAEIPGPLLVRAEEVVDRETLRQFVQEAVKDAESQVAIAEEAYAFFDATFRPEGAWRYGPIYLFVSEMDGTSFFHAVRPDLEGENLWDLEDADGVRITRELITAAAFGGGYVAYRWDNPEVEGDEDGGSPKLGYAELLTLGDRQLVIGSGIYPPVTAADVTNRGTLRSFVDRAAAVLAEAASDPERAYAFLDATFRPPGEWRHEDIYVFVLKTDGVNFFQAPDRSLEGQDRSQAEDQNGVKIVQEVLAAAEAGGGFVEYLWDNPAIEGDEEHGSPKLAYAIPVTVGSVPFVLGSGIYLNQP